MYISQSTINALKAQGITVRWYPEKTYEEFKKNQWAKEYKRWFEYSKFSCKEINPPKNDGSYESWQYETLAEYEESIRKFCDRIIDRHCSPYEFTTLYVEHDNGKIFAKKENVKSKEITVDYVLKYVEKSRKLYAGYYGNFSLKMQKICEKLGYSNFCVYPTTYGIGIWVFYNWKCNEQAEHVEDILKKAGIEYYNEYSDARWVFRFKISKKKGNLEKIFKVAS